MMRGTDQTIWVSL